MIPTNEQETIALFAQLSKELGYTFKEIGTQCPDAILEKDGQTIRVEFEHRAYNFKKHKHPADAVDLIVCWEDDWPTSPLPVLSLENYLALTQPMSRWERFWLWWSQLWLTRIRYMAEVRETRKKETRKKFCNTCGSPMNVRCENWISEDEDFLFNDIDFRCPRCGFRDFHIVHERTWLYGK